MSRAARLREDDQRAVWLTYNRAEDIANHTDAAGVKLSAHAPA